MSLQTPYHGDRLIVINIGRNGVTECGLLNLRLKSVCRCES